ncbi:MAG: RES domain-containing protein [Lachnospiraceae bacterium]
MSLSDNDKIKHFFNQLNTKAYLFNFEEWAKGNIKYWKDIDRFFEILDEVILVEYQNDFLVQIKKVSKFYRARVIPFTDYKSFHKGIGYEADRLRGYNWKESKEPPKNITTEQRNSKSGEEALYVADDEVTACAEAKSMVREYISVAEFELSDSVQVLDFSKMQFSKSFYQYNDTYGVNVREMLSTLEFYFSRPVYSKEEYVFSQQIVKHFREKGITGFKYRSFYSSGNNFTFFEDAINKFIWNDSRVVINYTTANLFISLDKINVTDLSNVNNIEKNISNDIRERMLEDTKQVWEAL